MSASTTCDNTQQVYYNQCGWEKAIVINGVNMDYFRFKDTDYENNAWAVHAGAYDNQEIQDANQMRHFAGIVCGQSSYAFFFLLKLYLGC